ncbi:hypothetical protein Tco_0261223 [Tanacetum coccineum]
MTELVGGLDKKYDVNLKEEVSSLNGPLYGGTHEIGCRVMGQNGIYSNVNVFHQRKLLEGTHTHDKMNPFKKMPQRTFQEDASNMYEILRSELKLILKRFMLRMEKSVLFIDEIHTELLMKQWMWLSIEANAWCSVVMWMLAIVSFATGNNNTLAFGKWDTSMMTWRDVKEIHDKADTGTDENIHISLFLNRKPLRLSVENWVA